MEKSGELWLSLPDRRSLSNHLADFESSASQRRHPIAQIVSGLPDGNGGPSARVCYHGAIEQQVDAERPKILNLIQGRIDRAIGMIEQDQGGDAVVQNIVIDAVFELPGEALAQWSFDKQAHIGILEWRRRRGA